MHPSFEQDSAANKQKKFEELAFVHTDSLFNTAVRLTKNVMDAEDLVQDTHVRAYRFFHKFKQDTNFKAWIFKILTNTFINHYRKKISQPRRVELEKIAYTLTEDSIDKTISTIETFKHDDYDTLFDDEITAALKLLPDDFRIVVLLSDIESFSYKEIAQIVGCPIGTVMSRLSRGRKRLQLHLREYASKGGYLTDVANIENHSTALDNEKKNWRQTHAMKKTERIDFLLTGYVDGELDDKQKKEVRALLEESPELRRQITDEENLKKALKEQATVHPAPPYLRRRIRRDIAQEQAKPTFGELIQKLFEYRPLATSMAFAVIALLILLPNYNRIMDTSSLLPTKDSGSNLAVTNGEIDGQIICLDCGLFSASKDPQGHDVELHSPGLRATNGEIWTILRTKEEDKLKYGLELLQKKARLSGLIFENSRYIRVNKYTLL